MSWIWLDPVKYPEYQNSFFNVNAAPEEERKKYGFCVARFEKRFDFEEEITNVDFRISADTFFHIYINGELVQIGPASPGGDFLCKRAYPVHLADLFSVNTSGKSFEITSLVKLLPQVLTDYSKGHGGFYCNLVFTGVSGRKYKYSTDETWSARREISYSGTGKFHLSQEEPFGSAVRTEDIWNLRNSEIPSLSLNRILEKEYTAAAGTKEKYSVELEKIYGVIPAVSADGACKVKLEISELEGQEITTEDVCFEKTGEYTSFTMHSAGRADVYIENTGAKPVNVKLIFIAPWYPVGEEGGFSCSDEKLNLVFETCKHTLKICRQSIHLDSTKHQEHLACTGDYYIESLMTLFCFDDMRLSEFDVKRTADWIRDNNGRMFHTTYSLIWVRMLRDVYMITGNRSLLAYCEEALETLMKRFDTYFTDTGVIENPPDYMFVDWTVVDGYSMHHPPKALGQTVLNAFYYDALNAARDVYLYAGKENKAQYYGEKAEKFKVCFNREFYDPEKELYFDGKSGGSYETNNWLPENPEKRYFTKYPDILACAFGLAEGEKAVQLARKIIFSREMQDIQPYFTHYLLRMLRVTGLTKEYAMKVFDRWKCVVQDCSKGLAEGWIPPQPDYKFDHSHAWGGTVAYHMPAFIAGLEIIEPGMKKIRLSPSLLGLESADIKMYTPGGFLKLHITEDGTAVEAPDGIEIISDQSFRDNNYH